MSLPRRDASRRAPVRAVVAVGVLAVLLALLAPGGPAGAHATLEDTSPAGDALVDEAPTTVELRFDEPVSATTGSVQVLDASGDRVDGAVRSLEGGRTVAVEVEGDEPGTRTVAYRVVSDDGHSISGSFVFHVRTRTGASEIDQSIPLATSAAGGVGRWLSYAGAIVAVGAALLVLATRGHGGPGGARRSLTRLVVGGAAVGALGGGLAVLAQVALATGRSVVGSAGLVTEVASDSRPVAMALVRAALVGLGALVAVLAGRRDGGLVAGAGLVAAGGLLAPVAGHPWTADPRALAVGADALHLLAASVWIGLLAALVVSARALPDPAAAVRAVSRAALVSSLVVLVTGAVSGWLLLGSVEALLRTASGQLVVAKVVGFAALVALGWVNRTHLVPALGRAVGAPMDEPAPALVGAGGAPVDEGAGTATGASEAPPSAEGPAPPAVGGPGPLGRLLALVRVELVVAALVLVATAALVNQPPGRDVMDEPFVGTATTEGVSLVLEVEPARAGANEMHLYLTDEAGAPAPVDALEVSAGREDVPARRLPVEQISPDHAVVYGASLPTPGTWEVEVTTVRVGIPRQFRFEVPVR